jgi:hypothetical protein
VIKRGLRCAALSARIFEREPKHFAGWVLPAKNLVRFRHRHCADRIVPEFEVILPGNVINLADRHWLFFERSLHGDNDRRIPNPRRMSAPTTAAIMTVPPPPILSGAEGCGRGGGGGKLTIMG